MLKYEPRLKSHSRQLRSNMTDAEQLLWSHLRRKQILGVQFYRQKPIGHFIADFFAPAIGLVVELDGEQHFEQNALQRDRKRDEFFQQQGLQVMRFDNAQVMKETESVLAMIFEFASAKSPLPPPFAKGGMIVLNEGCFYYPTTSPLCKRGGRGDLGSTHYPKGAVA